MSKIFNKYSVLKYLLYPFLIILFVLFLTSFKLNGSSVGIYNLILSNNYETDDALLFGNPRLIRSDQYIVSIPIISSQHLNDNTQINEDLGEGTNIATQYHASRNIFSVFRPTSLPFLFLEDVDLSYSFFWWSELGLLLISTYLLLLSVTKKNLTISILGSLFFLATPFVQWWNNYAILTWISFGLYFFLKILDEINLKKSILYSLGLSYSIIAFILILYPPFQIVVAYGAIAVAIAIIIEKKGFVLRNIKRILPLFLGAILISVFFIVLFLRTYDEVISITANTVYPGQRFITAGEGNRHYLFGSFYNLLLQDDSNTAPIGNQCESSNFFLLFPPLIVWVIYKNILLFKSKRKLDWLPITLSVLLLFFTAWYYLPLPDFISKYSLLSMVPSKRLGIGFGFASYLLMFYMFSNSIYRIRKNLIDYILAIVLSLSFGYLTYKFGYFLYNESPMFFQYPQIIGYQWKIILASLFSGLLVFLAFSQYKNLFLYLLLAFGILSTFYINPIYKGFGVLKNTELAEYISETSAKDDLPWVVYDDHYLAQYAFANGAHIINGVHLYPQFKIWEVLDPSGDYKDIYNRFAHVLVSQYEEGEEEIHLLLEDAIEININECDERWKELGIKYLMSRKEMHGDCLNLLQTFPENGVFIYQASW